MRIRIVEVINRSRQGITRPFLCRGEDGNQYFVKGDFAGRRALISEWLAGRIGQSLGLPIPPFIQVDVPGELVRYSARDDIRDLGAGIAFGSQVVENVDDLTYPFINQVDESLRATILLFDWWICNSDRILTDVGGNVNLLWFHRDRQLYVIDQNLAFDEENMAAFWDLHVFRDSIQLWTPEFRARMEPVMGEALRELTTWWNEMPGDWTNVESGLSFEAVERLLSRFSSDSCNFWRLR